MAPAPLTSFISRSQGGLSHPRPAAGSQFRAGLCHTAGWWGCTPTTELLGAAPWQPARFLGHRPRWEGRAPGAQLGAWPVPGLPVPSACPSWLPGLSWGGGGHSGTTCWEAVLPTPRADARVVGPRGGTRDARSPGLSGWASSPQPHTRLYPAWLPPLPAPLPSWAVAVFPSLPSPTCTARPLVPKPVGQKPAKTPPSEQGKKQSPLQPGPRAMPLPRLVPGRSPSAARPPGHAPSSPGAWPVH